MLNAQQPTPLLLIIASFDPNNNGINDYDPEHPELLYDPASPIYGEQWAISKPEDYYETFFAPNGHSLQDFYNIQVKCLLLVCSSYILFQIP